MDGPELAVVLRRRRLEAAEAELTEREARLVEKKRRLDDLQCLLEVREAEQKTRLRELNEAWDSFVPNAAASDTPSHPGR